ncbi:hypothetical protein WJX81_000050, partial [Elliptochloris bilobata]
MRRWAEEDDEPGNELRLLMDQDYPLMSGRLMSGLRMHALGRGWAAPLPPKPRQPPLPTQRSWLAPQLPAHL